MHIPQLMPDELLSGFIGRIGTLNCASRQRIQSQLGTLAYRGAKNTPSSQKTWAYILSEATRVNPEQIVRAHTLVPLLRAVRTDDSFCAHGDLLWSATVRRNELVLPKKKAFLCPSCADEDENFWGFGYWRRSHQIPGVEWCMKHQIPLTRCDIPNAFDQGTTYARRTDSVSAKHGPWNAKTQQYAHVCNGFLDFDRPVPARQAAYRLWKRAINSGLRIGRNGCRTNLSDMAAMQMPVGWLLDLFPDLKNKQGGDYFASLDGVTQQTRVAQRGTAYALAMSLLYPSADEALRDFSTPLDPAEMAWLASREDHLMPAEFCNRAPYARSTAADRHKRARVTIRLQGEPAHVCWPFLQTANT